MERKKINFIESREYRNGESFSFQFKGYETGSKTDYNKITKIIHKYMDESLCHQDMKNNVVVFKTILKELEEELLEITYNSLDYKETVKYENNRLTYYYCKSKSNESDSIETTFKIGSQLQFSFADSKEQLFNQTNRQITVEQITKTMNQIGCLMDAAPIELKANSRVLIEFYRLFYSENPDFTSKDINVRIQAMTMILRGYGINLPKDYSFNDFYPNQCPTSLCLTQDVQFLFPFGEVTEEECSTLLYGNKNIERIKVIGELVRKSVTDKVNIEKILIDLSKAIMECSFYPINHLDDNQVNCSLNQSTGQQLLKTINDNIFKTIIK